MLKAEHRFDADIFVVDKPTDPGVRTLWAAVLRGGRITVPSFLVEQQRGASIKYYPALKSKRQLWISGEFAAQHDVLTRVIRSCIETYPDCKWKLIATEAFFLNAKCAATRGKKTQDCIGFGHKT